MSTTDTIDSEDVGSVLRVDVRAEQDHTFPQKPDFSLRQQLDYYEKHLLKEAFERYQGNVTHIASALKTDRANLHRKLQKYGLK